MDLSENLLYVLPQDLLVNRSVYLLNPVYLYVRFQEFVVERDLFW